MLPEALRLTPDMALLDVQMPGINGLAAKSLTLGESPLTNRDRDVLSATTDGGTVAQIAARLFLSEGTVRNHLFSVKGNTGARTRADAVRIATERGWI